MKRSVSALAAIGVAVMVLVPAYAGNISISNGRTTPVQTSNADGTGPGDVTITGNGSVKVGPGPAVTLDSDNAVINQGTIQVTNDTDAVGVLFEAGHSGSLSNSGTIDALVTDTSSVSTGSGNIAFYVSGNGAFIGNLGFTTNSKVEAGGTNSFGIRLDSQVQGAISIAGTVSADGTGSTAFESNALITGDLTVAGTTTSVTASGGGARGMLVAGGIDGAFSVTGSVFANGAQTNVTYSGATPRADFAVGIGASVTKGFENDGTLSATSAGQALVVSPALGSQFSDITLGVVDATNTPFGLVNTGSITVSTARTGETINGVLIEGASDGVTDYGVVIDGGIKNTGSIGATTTGDGAAIALELGNNTTVPTVVNTGSMTSTVTATSSGVAYGLLLDTGANLASLTNSGSIVASATSGLDASAYGIVDHSGTLLSINNTGTISAAATSSGSGTTSSIAIDLTQAHGNVTLTNGGTITGDVLLDDHDDTVALVADSDGNAATTSSWTGALSFGGGDDTFLISGGGVFTGTIAKGAGTLAITVNDGVMALGAGDTVAATTIDFTSASKLTLVLDPSLAATPRLDATQSITFANGATIEASLTQFVGNDFAAVVARAPTIDASLTPGDLIFDNLPYLYSAQTQIVSAGEQELEIVLHLKTASDLGLNPNQSAFYASVLDIMSVSGNVLETPLLALSDQKAFFKTYEALMPNTSQPTLRSALITADDIDRAVQDRERVFLTGEKGFDGTNFWWTGSAHALSLDSGPLSRGIDGDIVSTTFGVDQIFMPWAMVGAELTFGGSDLNDAGSQDNIVHVNASHGGVYAALSAGPIYVSGSAGAGSTSNTSTRVLNTSSDTKISIDGAWDGTFLDADAEVGINAQLWNVVFRPWVGASWLQLKDEAYHETQGGTGFDLNYDAIDVDVERAKAGLTIGYNWVYPDFRVTPELRAVWSQVMNDLPSDLHGSFVDGAVPFVLSNAPIPKDQISAGFGVMMHGQNMAVALDYDATVADHEMTHTGTLEISTQF